LEIDVAFILLSSQIYPARLVRLALLWPFMLTSFVVWNWNALLAIRFISMTAFWKMICGDWSFLLFLLALSHRFIVIFYWTLTNPQM